MKISGTSTKAGIAFFGLLCFFALLLFPTPIDAGFFDTVLGGIGELFNQLLKIPVLFIGVYLGGIVAVLAVAGMAVAGLAGVLSVMLHWIIVQTMEISVVPGGGVDIVTQGWEFSRNFVNMLFLLILVFIGLATILKPLPIFQPYQLQKLLPMLILVAVLVNFSGVLVGVVVDLGNIITNFFISKISGFNFAFDGMKQIGAAAVSYFSGLILDLGKDVDVYFGNLASKVIKIVVLLIFFLAFILILSLVMLIFILRVAILWILTIVAPFAFAAAIIPQFRGVWDKWWNTLIQWAFVGIPITFFLYLASSLTTLTGKANVGEQFKGAPDDPEGLTLLLSELIAPTISLFLLAIGVALSMQLAPAAAQKVAAFGKGLGAKAGMAAGSFAWRKVGGPAAKYAGKLRTLGQKQGKFADLTIGDNAFTRRLGLAKKNVGVGSAARFGARWAGRAVETPAQRLNLLTRAKDKREIGEGRSEGQNEAAEDNLTKINEELQKGILANMNRIVGLMDAMVDNEDSNDLQEYLRDGRLDPTNMKKIIEASDRGGPNTSRPIKKALAHRFLDEKTTRAMGYDAKVERDGSNNPVRDAAGNIKFTGNDAKKVGEMVAEAIRKLSNQDVTAKVLGDSIDKGSAGGAEYAIGGKLLVEQIVTIHGADRLPTMFRRPETVEGKKEMAKVISDLVLRNFAQLDLIDPLIRRNVMRYMSGNAARSLGIELI